jgi:hypothetical protein
VIAAGLGVVPWLLGCFRGFRVLVAGLPGGFAAGRGLLAAGGLAWVILGWCLSCSAGCGRVYMGRSGGRGGVVL